MQRNWDYGQHQKIRRISNNSKLIIYYYVIILHLGFNNDKVQHNLSYHYVGFYLSLVHIFQKEGLYEISKNYVHFGNFLGN